MSKVDLSNSKGPKLRDPLGGKGLMFVKNQKKLPLPTFIYLKR